MKILRFPTCFNNSPVILKNRNGFTYLMALILIVIMGIMLGAIGQTWQTVMKRERETELLFRGSQIKDAITKWHTPGKDKPPTPLNDLKYLLEDPRTVDKVRYLRRMYTDPVTGKDWEIIRDSVRGIIGVRSSSQEAPLKVDGFPNELQDLAGKKKYSEWEFKYNPEVVKAGQQGTTTGTAEQFKK
jgi:type II secretory pathway pseudopilin PulG